LPLLSAKVVRYPTSLISYKVIDIIFNRVLIPITNLSSIVDLTSTFIRQEIFFRHIVAVCGNLLQTVQSRQWLIVVTDSHKPQST